MSFSRVTCAIGGLPIRERDDSLVTIWQKRPFIRVIVETMSRKTKALAEARAAWNVSERQTWALISA
ncbi:hypothetical protein CHH27_26140 [Labrenzia sp. VG12]|nr:hypothetical protein CHH27_26140 [Labrenzia sp. VG12]